MGKPQNINGSHGLDMKPTTNFKARKIKKKTCSLKMHSIQVPTYFLKDNISKLGRYSKTFKKTLEKCGKVFEIK